MDTFPLEEKLHRLNLISNHSNETARKTGPIVPPKPNKNQPKPEIPQSCYIGQACKPLYSQRLQFNDTTTTNNRENLRSTSVIGGGGSNLDEGCQLQLLQRKKQFLGQQNSLESDAGTVTLDNPAILEQQLEVLAHHKKQLERKGLLPLQQPLNNAPKLSTTSLARSGSDLIYANMQPPPPAPFEAPLPTKPLEDLKKAKEKPNSNVDIQRRYFENIQASQREPTPPTHKNLQNKIYSNIMYAKKEPDETVHSIYPQTPLTIEMPDDFGCHENSGEDFQTLPSPVSSSYSELRRANNTYSLKKNDNNLPKPPTLEGLNSLNSQSYEDAQNYLNVKYKNEYENQEHADYYGTGTFSQASTYESIYEPINPRPPSQLSCRSNFMNYSPYVNIPNAQLSNSSSLNMMNLADVETSLDNVSLYSSGGGGGGNGINQSASSLKSENEVETLTNYLVHSMDGGNDIDNYGICFKCNERVLGENSGCTAMNQIYHIACFTCSQCQINLQGKPFYALDGKPFCEYDYLQTLEKCSVCLKPILERILRATGKPYHPQCFKCVACGKSLDGIPFTVDATNQNYCIEDFHKKFAPRCCVCKEPIMPEPGEEETVRVVALDRSFHFECYKCEDCGLLLSSEAEGRGCYPLDDHVLCKSCNAKRVQHLTNFITTTEI